MATTLRTSDTFAEQEIAKFLDKHFYPKHVENFKRYSDYEHQMMGLDAEFDYKNFKRMLVDEKASSHYVNRNLPTFAFEVDFYTTAGNLVEGWLFDNKKSTQYYLLVWLWATKEKGFAADEITKAEIIIVERKAIIEMLAYYHVTPQIAAKFSTKIRTDGKEGKLYESTDRPFYFYYSGQLAEKPLNIVIKKSELIKLAIGKHIIEA